MPRGPRRSAASSHDRILLAAKRLFASRGYESTSTVAIARTAGTSESQLMKHFGSKEGLLEAIFEQAWQQINATIREALAREAVPARKLEAVTNVFLKTLQRDSDLRLLMLLEGRRIRKGARMVVLTRGFVEFIELLDQTLRELRAAGRLRPGLPVEGIRSALMGAFEGLMRDQLLAQRIRYPAPYSARQVRAVFNAILPSFVVSRHGGQARRR